MSVRRLAVTAAAMALVATALAGLTPAVGEMTDALTDPQLTVDTAGADAVVVAVTGLLAWVVWTWGALGLALTAASAVPGLLGAAARVGTQVLLPAGARRSAGLLLGLGLGVAAPITGGIGTVAIPAASAAAPVGAAPVGAAPVGAVPDWPGTAAPRRAPASGAVLASVPDWPAQAIAGAPQGSHVVVRGDCLWHIAAASLLDRTGRAPTDGEIAREVHAWWEANADVIGPDPDRLLPGQVLRPPEAT